MSHQLCHVSELDLFSSNPMQLSVIDTHENVYSTLQSLDNSSVLQFNIPGSSEHYIDLNNIYLRLKLQILNSDGTAYKSTDLDPKANQCGFINNILHSLFKSLRVSFNGTVINEISNYHIKSYIDTLLNYSSEHTNSSLLSQGFIKDKFGNKDKDGKNDNLGLKSRKYWTDDSQIIELYGRLNSDIFNQPKLLINGVNIDILLTLESASFLLMQLDATKDSIFKIHEANLHVRHVKVNPEYALQTYKTLLSGQNILYPFKRSEIKTFTVPKGQQSIELNNVFNGKQPSNFVLAMVENSAYTGNKQKNPYNFQHFNNKTITFNLNGVPIQPSPLEHSFNTTCGFTRTYAEFLKACDVFLSDKTNLIEREEFRKGYMLIPVNLSPRQMMDDSLCEDIPKEGSMSINLGFTAALASSITVIVYAEYSEMLKIDKNMNVTV